MKFLSMFDGVQFVVLHTVAFMLRRVGMGIVLLVNTYVIEMILKFIVLPKKGQK